MKIMVTGGAGFIGSNLVYRLLDLGGEVLVIDNLRTGYFENLDPRAGFRHMDVTDPFFEQACIDFQPDVIVHLAALVFVAESFEKPELARSINVDGTRAVVRAAKACGAERVIFSSTAAVYGIPAETPLTETSPVGPVSPYGETKLEAERIIEEELRGSGVDFAIFRFGNVFGPRQSTEGEGGVVAMFCDALAKGEAPTINGDGEQVRDYIFVADLVTALVSGIGGEIEFAEDPATSAAPGIYNISTGKGTSVNELAMELRVHAKFFRPFNHGPARPGDVSVSILSAEKAAATFEFVPEVPLERGLALTWMWFATKHGVDVVGTEDWSAPPPGL